MAERGTDRADTASEYLPIREYAAIGNCKTAALVGSNGSIDWYCPGRFDAPAALSRILDARRGGFLSVRPDGKWRIERGYLEDTNVLITTFRGDQGEVSVADYMPMTGDGNEVEIDEPGLPTIVRHISCVVGKADVRIRYRPGWNYGLIRPQVEHIPGCGVISECGDAFLGFSCAATQLEDREGVWEGVVCLRAGERCELALEHAPDREAALAALARPIEADDLSRTVKHWRDWAGRCSYSGPYRDAVIRSALALKLLTYNPTGALVAAPTTSLPEEIGGERNWDYRYTWLRDSSLILYSLVTLNYHHEAVRFLRWLEKVVGARTRQIPQIMYTVDGGRELSERDLPELEGYRGSRPVRVGNAAAGQVQLDIYGEVLTSAYVHYHRPEGDGRSGRGEKPDRAAWSVLSALVDDAVEHWEEPDNGIWEVRGGPRQFLYSKLMCWAAADRGLRIAREHGLDADLERWHEASVRMRERIETEGYNEKLGAFVQSFGSETLDAAVLVIPRIGFLPANDPRVLSTIDRVKSELMVDGLVYRYRSEDGLSGGEGTFLLCTFWLVEALALAGRIDEARDLFERTLALANDVGLFSEELDPKSKAFLGNFPQGFTHLAVIRAAVDLARAHAHGAEETGTTEGERARHVKSVIGSRQPGLNCQ